MGGFFSKPSLKGGIALNYKVLGLFGIIIITVAVTFQIFHHAPETFSGTAEVSEITPKMIGVVRETRGIVLNLNEGKGNIFFTLKDVNTDKKIKGVIFSKTNVNNPEFKNLLIQSRDEKSVIFLNGEIDVYKGELEIKTWQVFKND